MDMETVPSANAFHPSPGSDVPPRSTIAGKSVVVFVSTTMIGARSAPMYARSRTVSSAMSCMKNRSAGYQNE